MAAGACPLHMQTSPTTSRLLTTWVLLSPNQGLHLHQRQLTLACLWLQDGIYEPSD